jgi:GNAT superfamily N-acetyltransferase
VRRADSDDAMAVATVYVRSWQGAFPTLIPQSYLDAMRPEDTVVKVRTWLEATAWPHQGTVVLLGLPGGDTDDVTVTGFVAMGPSRDDDTGGGAVGEIMTLYLDPGVFGRGGGRLLLDTAFGELRGGGFTRATLWVLDTNTRARRFYERHGWLPDGATKVHDWEAFVATDVRYAIDLA